VKNLVRLSLAGFIIPLHRTGGGDILLLTNNDLTTYNGIFLQTKREDCVVEGAGDGVCVWLGDDLWVVWKRSIIGIWLLYELFWQRQRYDGVVIVRLMKDINLKGMYVRLVEGT